MSEIKITGLSVYYDDKYKNVTTALDNLSLTFESGKISVLIGPSGCGKTTLFNCLSGKLVYQGKIEIDGKDIEKMKVKDHHLSYVNQSFVLYPHMTVYDNIAFPLINKKLPRDICDEMVLSIADDFDIYYLLTRKPKQISLGQAQRVAIARAIINETDILLFDEPLSNLDKENGEEIRRLIRKKVNQNKSTLIYATHDIKDALALADDIFVIDQGKLVGKYSPSELVESTNPLVRSLLSDVIKP